MADLIEKNELLQKMGRYFCRSCDNNEGLKCRECEAGIAGDFVADAPIIDAVPVVRCKDCKHSYRSSGSSTGYRCHCWGMWGEDHEVEADGFCHIGERRTNHGK